MGPMQATVPFPTERNNSSFVVNNSTKFVTVEEVAALVRFLCGIEAASITGAVLPIEGGWTAH